jgi:hypothetical protein
VGFRLRRQVPFNTAKKWVVNGQRFNANKQRQ